MATDEKPPDDKHPWIKVNGQWVYPVVDDPEDFTPMTQPDTTTSDN